MEIAMSKHLGILAIASLWLVLLAAPSHANRISDEHCAPGQTLNPFTSICEGPTNSQFVFVMQDSWIGFWPEHTQWHRHRFHRHHH